MTVQIARIGLSFALGLVLVSGIQAGIYSSMDAPEETRFSQDYERVFSRVISTPR